MIRSFNGVPILVEVFVIYSIFSLLFSIDDDNINIMMSDIPVPGTTGTKYL